MARYVFVADTRPDWNMARALIDSVEDDGLRLTAPAYETGDLDRVRDALLDGIDLLRAEWDANFFLDAGVVAADTLELDRLGAALSELGVLRSIGLNVRVAAPG